MTNKKYEYVCKTKEGEITPFSIYANIIDEKDGNVTIERAQKYGEFPISNMIMSQKEFYQYYDNIDSIRSYESEHFSGFEIDTKVSGEKATVVFVTKSNTNAEVPTYYFKNTTFPLDSPIGSWIYPWTFQAEIEYKALNTVIDSHHPLITDDIKEFAKDVLDTGNEIKDLARNKRAFYYATPFEDIRINPCINSNGILEYLLVDSDVVNSDGSVFCIAKDIVNYEHILKAQEQSKADLQQFYEEKIKVLKGRTDLSREEIENLNTFSDWHKDLYGYRPRGDRNACETAKAHRASPENTSREL